MKKKIKQIVVPIFLSVLCGFICGRLMFSIYEEKGKNILELNTIYLLKDNSYNDYDSMKASSLSNNYIYYEDEGKYNTIIAITKNKDNIDKIKKIYNKELTIMEYILKDEEMNNKLEAYDLELTKAQKDEDIKEVINKMINVYKDKEDVKMIKISWQFIIFNIELYM